MLLLSLSFFLTISLLFYAIMAVPAAKKAHIQKRIQTYFTAEPSAAIPEEEGDNRSFMERMVKPAWKKVKKNYQKKLNKEKADKLEIRLLQAGQPFGYSPVEFKILQVGLMVGLPLIFAGLAFLSHSSLMIGMLMVLGALGAAIMFPKSFLKMRAQKRMNAALKELPDTLDLLTISLEAGLGFDAALSKVTSKKNGVLSDEFKVCLEEIRLGKTRKEALSAINLRLPLEEIKALTYSIIQAEKLGIGMVTVLKVQTEDIREQRKQRAEEKAMKAPIKMLFPLVMFIFPTLFIVLLGPAVLQFLDAMK
ncbi:type II secretion system F family protein [Sediminibacillus massiliensis]|uniref:type II secretion system F family protein n=1 Tax=Sediminibacillus massiliensis TaxID=1926277 RepID=UPI0015C3FBA5|nr:type II secretion system F family protein [Sediminibacillus massiliensis]